MKRILIIIQILVLPLLFYAQNEKKTLILSIKEAQNYAIENNKALKNSYYDVEIAKRQMWQTIAKGLPQVSATIDYTNYFNYSMSLGFGSSNGITLNAEQLALLDQGDVAILNLLQQAMGGSSSGDIKMNNTSNAKLQVSQLLFSGEYITSIQMQKIAQMLIEINNEKNVLDIKEQVINTYYQSLIINKSIDILNANIDNLTNTLQKTEVLYKTGMIEETDVDQLKLSLLSLEISRNSLQRNAELNLNLMKIHLSLKPDDEIILSDKYDSVFESIDLLTVLDIQSDIENNINVRLLKKQENLYERQVALKQWAYAPTLVAAYNYTEKLMKTNFDMTPKNLFTLQLNIPIWSSGERTAAVQEQKLELLKIQNNREVLYEQLELQEQQLRLNLISAIEKYNSQKENLILAEKIFNKTELKFRQGVVSSFDLMQANTNLLQIQSSFLQSGMDVLQAKLTLDKFLDKI